MKQTLSFGGSPNQGDFHLPPYAEYATVGEGVSLFPACVPGADRGKLFSLGEQIRATPFCVDQSIAALPFSHNWFVSRSLLIIGSDVRSEDRREPQPSRRSIH